MRLTELVNNSESPAGRAFDLLVQLLILVSLLTFSLETLPDLSAESRQILRWVELGCIVIFTLEYVLRVMVAESKRGFVFSFFGIVDLISILPFYLALGFDLRSLRALRLLRLARTLKLVRYSRAIQRLQRAFVIAWDELLLFSFGAMIMLYFSAVGIYYFENPAQPEVFSSVFDGMWWAIVTLTTVGYGDAYPITMGGRMFTFFVVIVGLGIVAVPTGLLASALATARQEEAEDLLHPKAGAKPGKDEDSI